MFNSTSLRLAQRDMPPGIRTEPRASSAASATSQLPAMPAPRASSTPAKPEAAAPVVIAGFAQADIDRAVAKARAEERASIVALFASSASEGRERACATLLGKGFAASAIAKEIAHLPTDAELAQEKRQARLDKAAAAWDRAYPGKSTKPAASTTDRKAADHSKADVWQRAYASLQPL